MENCAVNEDTHGKMKDRLPFVREQSDERNL